MLDNSEKAEFTGEMNGTSRSWKNAGKNKLKRCNNKKKK